MAKDLTSRKGVLKYREIPANVPFFGTIRVYDR